MYKNILSSTLPLFITVILFIIVGNIGIGRVQKLQAEILQAQADKATLTQKVSVLQSLSASVGTGSQASAAALPEKNAGLIELTQLKSLAAQNSVALSSLKSGSVNKATGGLSSTDISFTVTGPRQAILSFLEAIQKSAPISLVDRIKISELGGETQAAIAVKSFSAVFPKTIPAVEQSVTDLTADEQNILAKISSLAQPQFVELPAQQAGGGKANPFIQ